MDNENGFDDNDKILELQSKIYYDLHNIHNKYANKLNKIIKKKTRDDFIYNIDSYNYYFDYITNENCQRFSYDIPNKTWYYFIYSNNGNKYITSSNLLNDIIYNYLSLNNKLSLVIYSNSDVEDINDLFDNMNLES